MAGNGHKNRRKKYFRLNRSKLAVIVVLVVFLLGTLGVPLKDFFSPANMLTAQEGHLNQAKLYYSQADYPAAVEELTRFIETSPVENDALVIESYRLRGLAHLLMEEYELAAGDLAVYLGYEPGDTLLHYQLGILYTAMDKDSEALQSFTRALQGDGNMIEAYIERSRLLFNEGNFSGALLDLESAIELSPGDPHLFLNRGKVYLALSREGEALKDFTQAISLDSGHLEAYLHRGNIYLSLSDFTAAVEDFSLVITRAAETGIGADPYLRRGLAYYFLGRFEAAITDWKTYLEHAPGDAETCFRIGAAYQKLKDYPLSIQYFTRALALDESYGSAYYQRANAYSLVEKYDKAVEDYSRALDLLETDLDTAYFNRGVAYVNLKKWTLARKDFEKVLVVTSDTELAGDARKILDQLKQL